MWFQEKPSERQNNGVLWYKSLCVCLCNAALNSMRGRPILLIGILNALCAVWCIQAEFIHRPIWLKFNWWLFLFKLKVSCFFYVFCFYFFPRPLWLIHLLCENDGWQIFLIIRLRMASVRCLFIISVVKQKIVPLR